MQHIPFFPLPLCVFEDEWLPLHIFEPRYRRLVKDCWESQALFGIPLILDGKPTEWGTALRIDRIIKNYPDGKYDIMCRAIFRFKITEWFTPESADMYHHGMVNMEKLTEDEDKELKFRLTDLVNGFYHISGIQTVVDPETPMLQWIHKCGLDLKQEFELLQMNSVSERQMYLVHHLKNLISALEKTEQARKMVKLNGHPKKINSAF